MKKLMIALMSIFAVGIFSLSAGTELAPAQEGLTLDAFKDQVMSDFKAQEEKEELF